MIVLGIESSCDEFAAAVLDTDGQTLRSNVVHSQAELHNQYGGVVPEIASRDHIRALSQVVARALEEAGCSLNDLGGIAVTRGPGLVGSLLAGLEAAKGLCVGTGLPLVGIHHLEGHIAAASLQEPTLEAPFVTLIVSGGHTSLVRVERHGGPYKLMGATRDDAAGEAFDKTAKIIGLGYPGGIAIDRTSQQGDRQRFPFPNAMPGKDNLEFSFSGLKTAASRTVKELGGAPDGEVLADFCASFQHAVVNNLLKKAFRAVELAETDTLVVVGGVAANSYLRARAEERARRQKVRLVLPTKENCTDNAAMIARAGWLRLIRGERSPLEMNARPQWSLTDLE